MEVIAASAELEAPDDSSQGSDGERPLKEEDGEEKVGEVDERADEAHPRKLLLSRSSLRSIGDGMGVEAHWG
jgi:hypothetical protein